MGAQPCSPSDPVPGTGVTEMHHPRLFGTSARVVEAVREESDGPKREGQLTGWSSSEDGGVRRSRTARMKGNSCSVQASR